MPFGTNTSCYNTRRDPVDLGGMQKVCGADGASVPECGYLAILVDVKVVIATVAVKIRCSLR